MRMGRSVVIPTILGLAVAGSILAGSVAPAVTAQAPSAHPHTAVVAAAPETMYYG